MFSQNRTAFAEWIPEMDSNWKWTWKWWKNWNWNAHLQMAERRACAVGFAQWRRRRTGLPCCARFLMWTFAVFFAASESWNFLGEVLMWICSEHVCLFVLQSDTISGPCSLLLFLLWLWQGTTTRRYGANPLLVNSVLFCSFGLLACLCFEYINHRGDASTQWMNGWIIELVQTKIIIINGDKHSLPHSLARFT